MRLISEGMDRTMRPIVVIQKRNQRTLVSYKIFFTGCCVAFPQLITSTSIIVGVRIFDLQLVP